MQITSTPSTASKSTVTDPSKAGFNALNSQDFLKLVLTQLQNQDPTAPTDNAALLNQLSSIRSLQSNIELEDSLKSLSLNQQLSQGAAFIGKNITGVDDNQKQVSGLVDHISVRDGKTFVGFGNHEIQVGQITGVNAAS